VPKDGLNEFLNLFGREDIILANIRNGV